MYQNFYRNWSFSWKSVVGFINLLFLNKIKRIEYAPSYITATLEEQGNDFHRFKDYYDNNILGKLEPFEGKRIEALKLFRNRAWRSLIAISILMFLLKYAAFDIHRQDFPEFIRNNFDSPEALIIIPIIFMYSRFYRLCR